MLRQSKEKENKNRGWQHRDKVCRTGFMNKKYGISNIRQISRNCYYIGLGIGVIGILCILIIFAMHIPVAEKFPGCFLYTATGVYCPGCGGTRAVYALLRGDIIKSLYYHPFVVYAAVYYILYEASHTLDLITHGKVRGLYFCPPYFYIGAVLIVVQCIIKNILKFRFGFIL